MMYFYLRVYDVAEDVPPGSTENEYVFHFRAVDWPSDEELASYILGKMPYLTADGSDDIPSDALPGTTACMLELYPIEFDEITVSVEEETPSTPPTPFDDSADRFYADLAALVALAREPDDSQPDTPPNTEHVVFSVILAHPDAVLPTRSTELASGLDLHTIQDGEVVFGEVTVFDTGLDVANIPLGYEVQIRPRSGLAFKNGVTVVNAPGTVDADYRGRLKVALTCVREGGYFIKKGDRIAQAVVCPVPRSVCVAANVSTPTARGAAGFGSTGR